MVGEFLFPSFVFALTSGPSQPEFSSFEPVATTNMVNEYSGDLTYNLPVLEIPGPDGGGYSMSLSYHSGASPEEDASWVGYGWTLNPGAIVRSKRGFADDWNGSAVKYYNRVPKNWTASVGGNTGGLEIFSFDAPIGLNSSIRYNNYKGFGYVAGAGVSVKGIASLGYSVSDGEGSFSLSINPARLLDQKRDEGKKDEEQPKVKEAKTTKDMESENKAQANKKVGRIRKPLGALGQITSQYGMHVLGSDLRPTNITGFTGGSFNLSVSVEVVPAVVPIGVETGLNGNYTWQENIPETELAAYGSMYSSNAGSEAMMDYFRERETPYVKRDLYLSIPFQSPDNFGVSGESIGGGFRLHNRHAGHFHPNETRSSMVISQLGGEIQVGTNIGLGADAGVGESSLKVEGWGNDGYTFAGDGDEPYHFRFANDRGGFKTFGDDKAYRAGFDPVSSVPGVKRFSPRVNAQVPLEMNSGERSGRSSFIGYHTNREMLETSNGFHYNSFTQVPALLDGPGTWVDRTELPDAVGEFAITNEAGMMHVYGLPCYSRREGNLQYGLEGTPASAINSNYLVYNSRTPANADWVVGEERYDAYASSYLLTEIRTPDYLDRTHNGPSPDDFGGYTVFEYERTAGDRKMNSSSDADWYKWRAPYNGLLYDRRELSDPGDDAGSVVYGEKQIYYLHKVETRTHYATFFTSKRDDGLEAEHTEAVASASPNAKGTKQLRKLDRIELYARGQGNNPGKLIKTINFEYDYSSWPGIPNTVNPGGGKLTLRKVWFEHEETNNARINPYTFFYQYPKGDPLNCPDVSASRDFSYVNYPGRYADLLTSQPNLNETPGYDPLALDPWGCYQADAANRFQNMKPWVNQNRSQLANLNFDPAAWQLKSIGLPSGGEIHIQYEQDDYQYVQDRKAMAMVSLDPSGSEDSGPQYIGNNKPDNRYYLNTQADLGIPVGSQFQVEMKNLIHKKFVQNKEKIYFKFLYALIGGVADMDRCNSEYVTGYAEVEDVGIDGNGVYIDIVKNKPYSTPRKVCRDLVRSSKGGKLDPFNDCNASTSGIVNNNDPEDILMQLVGKIGNTFAGPAINCLNVDFEHSYLKVPLPVAKLGGGIRVKRLMMYDRGLECGDEVLYGTEYLYQDTEGRSSGVASNEANAAREENPLVTLLDRQNQSFLNKVIAGRDKKQMEGPLGESLLPPATVAYGRVIAKSIHSGQTNPGFTINEFYTYKDYPFDYRFPFVDNGSSATKATTISRKKDWMAIPAGLVNYYVNNLWLTQGYRFVKYEIPGQPRSIATYGGDFANAGDPSQLQLSAYQEFKYFHPGEMVPIMRSPEEIDQNGWFPGKEMDVVMESRAVHDIAKDLNVEFDVSVGLLFIPLPFSSAMPSVSYNESRLHTHVTTKVVRYPAIRKQVRSYQDGMWHVTDNMAFNPHNGEPILTRTTDGYQSLDLALSTGHKGFYHTFSIPAANEYPAMGQIAGNERLVLTSGQNNLNIRKIADGAGDYFLTITSNAPGPNPAVCDALGRFEGGDLIQIKMAGRNAVDGIFHLGEMNGNQVPLLPSGFYNAGTYTGQVDIEIIRSGRTNQLATALGGFTTYGDEPTLIRQPIDPTIMAARQQIASDLTNIVSGRSNSGSVLIDPCTFDQTYSFDPAVVLTKLPENLKLELFDYYDSGQQILCTEFIPYNGSGQFRIDPETGEMLFFSGDNACYGRKLDCLSFCKKVTASWRLPNVIAARAQTVGDHWPYDHAIYGSPVPGANVYETGEKGNWRQLSGYTYKEQIISGAKDEAPDNERIYLDAGVFGHKLFNYGVPLANDPGKWLKMSTVTRYSPHGNATEERDILGILSAVKFGYDHTLPYLIANNSSYDEVYFESFEKVYEVGGSFELEDGVGIRDTSKIARSVSHAGNRSLRTGASFSMRPFELDAHLMARGMSFMVWVKDPLHKKDVVTGKLQSGSKSKLLDFEWIASAGEWNLYNARINPGASWGNLGTGDLVTPNIYPKNPHGCDDPAECPRYEYWLDDIRYQPLDAKMVCYVYDVNTLKLLCTFDDQHFGLYNQFNGEGQLVRKIMETERGSKTVRETQDHIPEQRKTQ